MGINFSNFIKKYLKLQNNWIQNKNYYCQTPFLCNEKQFDNDSKKNNQSLNEAYRIEEKIILLKPAKICDRQKKSIKICENSINQNTSKSLEYEIQNELKPHIPKVYQENLKRAYPLGLHGYFNEKDGYSYSLIFHYADDYSLAMKLFIENFNLNINKMGYRHFQMWCIENQQLNSINLYKRMIQNCKGKIRLIQKLKENFSVELHMSDRFQKNNGHWFRALVLIHKNKRKLYSAFRSIKTSLMISRIPIYTLDEIKTNFTSEI